ncbi:hypothetical protein BD310DRAFT_932818 [Dichomitus squalens]|uniref:Uncharacterized protein n=1 Tax=Dichomitus squalens TaxID=114155 RepID=A0A4Q9PNG7_9APHY|nr:hypothetical protein BD310DRAFT_932818 [Dichomitus squalens]
MYLCCTESGLFRLWVYRDRIQKAAGILSTCSHASGSFLSSCGGLYLCCAATSSLSHRIRRSSEHPFGISTPTAKYSVQSDLLYHRRL